MKQASVRSSGILPVRSLAGYGSAFNVPRRDPGRDFATLRGDMIDPSRPDYRNHPASDLRTGFEYAPGPIAAPAVSIITPFYDAGDEFRETATSVLRQSLQQWEWLIVNDGSRNAASLRMLDEYRGPDPRIRVIDLPANCGLGAARNRGFEDARSEFVLQLDADDLLEPTAAEKWLWFLHANPEYAFVKGLTVGFGASEYLWNRGFSAGRAFLRSNLVNPTAMVRRSVHAEVGGYDEAYHGGLGDWQFWLRCAAAGHWGATVPEYLDWYRRRTDHTDRWPDFDDGVRQRRFRKRLRRELPSLWRGRFPRPVAAGSSWSAGIPDGSPCENPLEKRKPRALLLTAWFRVGGADRFNLDLMEQLREHGWEITVASTLPSDDEWLAGYAARTPDVFALHRFLRAIDYPRFLAYLVRSRRIDAAIISHSEFGYHLLPWLRSRCPDTAFVDYLHVVEPTWIDGGYPALSARFHEYLDLTVTSSEQVRRWLLERGAAAGRVETCHTNVDAEAKGPDPVVRRTLRAKHGVADEVPVLLFAGRICDQKQPRVLASTLERLHAAGVEFVAWIAGGGPDLEALRARLMGGALASRVRLFGELPNADVIGLMQAADLLFLPSRYEGIALVLFEAMAAALPVVSADVGGQRELVTPECGVLIPTATPAEEAERYAGILAELLADPARRAAMGRAGRERVETRFRIDQMGERMEALLRRAGALARSSPRVTAAPRDPAVESDTAARLARIVPPGVESWSRTKRQRFGTSVHTMLSRWFAPIHDWSMRAGWTWVPKAGLAARRFLLGGGRSADS